MRRQPASLIKTPPHLFSLSIFRNGRSFNFPPLAQAALAQLCALGAVFLLAYGVARAGGNIPLGGLVFLEGGLAAGISYFWGMMPWWLPIQLLFVPALAAGLAWDVEPAWYLVGFLILLVVYWSVFRTQVPLYLSSKAAWHAVAARLPEKRDFRLIDLGSGLGGLLVFLGKARSDGHYTGIEAAPLPFLIGWIRGARRGCEMRFGSFWKRNLADYDIAYAYLSPVPMDDLWRKVKEEMRPGSLFISNTFAVPGITADETVLLDDFHGSVLYLYRL